MFLKGRAGRSDKSERHLAYVISEAHTRLSTSPTADWRAGTFLSKAGTLGLVEALEVSLWLPAGRDGLQFSSDDRCAVACTIRNLVTAVSNFERVDASVYASSTSSRRAASASTNSRNCSKSPGTLSRSLSSRAWNSCQLPMSASRCAATRTASISLCSRYADN